MTEREWLVSENTAHKIRSWASQLNEGRDEQRVLRLFMVALCRLYGKHHYVDDYLKAVKASEQFADQRISLDELIKQRRGAVTRTPAELEDRAYALVSGLNYYTPCLDLLELLDGRLFDKGLHRAFHDIFGNPFTVLPPLRQEWVTPDVLSLAHAAYEERIRGELDPVRLNVRSCSVECSRRCTGRRWLPEYVAAVQVLQRNQGSPLLLLLDLRLRRVRFRLGKTLPVGCYQTVFALL